MFNIIYYLLIPGNKNRERIAKEKDEAAKVRERNKKEKEKRRRREAADQKGNRKVMINLCLIYF